MVNSLSSQIASSESSSLKEKRPKASKKKKSLQKSQERTKIDNKVDEQRSLTNEVPLLEKPKAKLVSEEPISDGKSIWQEKVANLNLI